MLILNWFMLVEFNMYLQVGVKSLKFMIFGYGFCLLIGLRCGKIFIKKKNLKYLIKILDKLMLMYLKKGVKFVNFLM